MVCIESLIAQYTSAEDHLPEPVLERVAQVRDAWSKGHYLALLNGLTALRRFYEARPHVPSVAKVTNAKRA